MSYPGAIPFPSPSPRKMREYWSIGVPLKRETCVDENAGMDRNVLFGLVWFDGSGWQDGRINESR